MLLQQMRLFAAVAREGSIVGAASSLRIAQPALSRQIRRLEDEVGVPLFERQRRGVELTPSGVALLSETDELFARLDEAIWRTREAHAGTSGSLRVALGRLALENSRVSDAIAALRRQLPLVRLDLIDIPSLLQLEALRTREVDIAIGMADFDDASALQTAVIFEEVLDCAMLSVGHPLARQPSVDIAQLRNEPYLIVRTTTAGGYPIISAAVTAAGITPAEVYDSVESVWGFVAAGRGWGTASRTLLASPPVGTAVLPIRGFSVRTPMYLRWRRGDRSRALHNVVERLRALASGKDDAESTDESSAPRANSRASAGSVGSSGMAALELGQLKALVAATEERSLSRAAERLHLTQSGVSRRIKALEREVGCKLMERGAKGIAPTDAGATLFAEAHDVLRRADVALTRARQAAGGITGTCRLGALPPELTGRFQASALRRVMETVPQIGLELSEMLPERQVQALRDRSIDIGIGGGFPGMPLDPMISSVRLMEDPLDCSLLKSTHPLASRSWVTVAELRSEPFLFINRENGRRVYDGVMKALRAIGLAPDPLPGHGGMRAVWRAVATGEGWTVGSRSQHANPPGGLVAVPIEGLNVPWGLMLFWRSDETDPGVRRVLDVFRTIPRGDMAVSGAGIHAAAAAPEP